jgi:hypothetical protein
MKAKNGGPPTAMWWSSRSTMAARYLFLDSLSASFK